MEVSAMEKWSPPRRTQGCRRHQKRRRGWKIPTGTETQGIAEIDGQKSNLSTKQLDGGTGETTLEVRSFQFGRSSQIEQQFGRPSLGLARSAGSAQRTLGWICWVCWTGKSTGSAGSLEQTDGSPGRTELTDGQICRTDGWICRKDGRNCRELWG
ncbi:unnamed protein product [Cuscuta campestris]|uniref:Uncharacterized protein n=1 Tax=Cuscuta campestris TaxID=132261 RepID=A0A484N602_9ASTE|nr:unnamed protein product [Cuscuta campestris]